MRIKRIAAAIALILAITTGCQKISVYRQPKGNGSEEEKTQIHSRDIAEKERFIVKLDYIRSGAADIFRDVLINDWDSSNNKAQDIKKNFEEAKPALIKKGVSPDILGDAERSIGSLLDAIKDKNLHDAGFEANEVSKDIIEVINYYDPPFPSDFGKMGYQLRLIILQSEIRDTEAVNEALIHAARHWATLKPQLYGVYGDDAAVTDSYYTELKDALDEKDLDKVKTISLNILSYMEILEMHLTNIKTGHPN